MERETDEEEFPRQKHKTITLFENGQKAHKNYVKASDNELSVCFYRLSTLYLREKKIEKNERERAKERERGERIQNQHHVVAALCLIPAALSFTTVTQYDFDYTQCTRRAVGQKSARKP